MRFLLPAMLLLECAPEPWMFHWILWTIATISWLCYDGDSK